MKYVWNQELASMPEAFISLSKPRRVLEAAIGPYDSAHLASKMEEAEFAEFHDPACVAGVFAGTRRNGFGSVDDRVLQHDPGVFQQGEMGSGPGDCRVEQFP